MKKTRASERGGAFFTGRAPGDALVSSVRDGASGPTAAAGSLFLGQELVSEDEETRDMYAFETTQDWEMVKYHENSSM